MKFSILFILLISSCFSEEITLTATGSRLNGDASFIPFKIGETSITIQRVKIARVSTEKGDVSDDKYAIFVILIENGSKTKLVNYMPLSGKTLDNGDCATLSDNFENMYKRVGFGFSNKIKGQKTSDETIYPGKEIQDVIVFKRPIDMAKTMILNIPHKNFGSTGETKINIPINLFVESNL